ncbi:nucleotide sugar dehydrogenase [Fuerstiella marisgermanici]|uniref:UDP-N-acetyl-D-glucosamine 6-dehydrogenase n=1 Tax=Fuerstiella marisgermanici TaxID=1891926 RepID=A0A1P8WPF8_9PLAN|nr:nucleotide sugar dehydrogenase [Fuerstiella marisgermanici]APZ95952.1 UDP-N-acetyl-D-glucosamine 6-dehydrogenase [Fuerstiella marisgermanici]
MSNVPNQLNERVANKQAVVGVIGLGYVGLPLLDAFLEVGFRCIGFDVDQPKIDSLAAGKSYIRHIPDSQIKAWQDSGRFEATSDMERLAEADAILICVPTPLTASRDPDLRFVEATTEAVSKTLRCGQLVVLESTTYPTTTRDIVLPILEKSGLKVGSDFHLAYSPEREDPGNADYSAKGIPKIVGGITGECSRLAGQLYDHAVAAVIPVGSCEVAEAAKILENVYRAVNIALVNELKVLFDRIDIDVWEVVDAAKTKPFGFQAFYPGPGLGGHCIPIDPFYLSWLARRSGLSTRFIELAGEVNHSMPSYVIERLMKALNDDGKPIKGSAICVLGVAYKKNVDDPRESPSFVLIEELLQLGANLTYHDPYVPTLPSMRHHDLPSMNSSPLTGDFLSSLDAVLIATDHDDVAYDLVAEHAHLIVDTRNAMSGIAKGRARIVKA